MYNIKTVTCIKSIQFLQSYKIIHTIIYSLSKISNLIFKSKINLIKEHANY